MSLNSVVAERSFRVDRMAVSEKELVAMCPQLKPYSYIFYTDPASVSDLKDMFLPSKLWRMNNLYKVKTKSSEDGNLVVPFVMKRGQLILYFSLLGHPRVVVLKSRQIGISTATVLMYGDDMLTIPHLKVGIVAQAQDPADDLLAKITFALKSLDVEIAKFFRLRIVVDNNSNVGLSNGSEAEARLSFRSGTLQRFAWTEVGKIAAEDPKRVSETLTGSMQAIEPTKDNWIVKESTAEGDNYFKTDFYSAQAKMGKPITYKESRALFFSWLNDPTCNSNIIPEFYDERVEKVVSQIEKEYSKYIQTAAYKAQIGNFIYPDGYEYRLSDTQKAWLSGVLDELNYDLEFFFREYPHTPDSAFYISGDRMWYKKALVDLEESGRLVSTPEGREFSILYNPEYQVFAVGDIGYNDLFFILYVQVIDTGFVDSSGLEIWEIRVLGEDYGSDAKTDYYSSLIYSQPYECDMLFLPHDGNRGTVLKDSKTVADDFIDMGHNVEVLPRPTRLLPQILLTRRRLYHTRIDVSRAPKLWTNLNNYKKAYDKKLEMFKSEPVHDEHSHGADAFRYVCNLPYPCSTKVESFKTVNYSSGYYGTPVYTPGDIGI